MSMRCRILFVSVILLLIFWFTSVAYIFSPKLTTSSNQLRSSSIPHSNSISSIQSSCPELKQSDYTVHTIQIAYFIRGSNSASALIRLLDTIYSKDQHYYLVHLDKKSSQKEQNRLKNHIQSKNAKNIFTFDQPYDVHYMSFDLLYLDVRAVLYFLHLTKTEVITRFDYFINLCKFLGLLY